MTDQLRRLAGALCVGFAVIAVALGYWQVVRSESVLAVPSNPRGIEEERRIVRGRILDRNGEVLAESHRVGELAERTYTYPPLAHVTGYVSLRYGKVGIEEAFDSYLKGERSLDAVSALERRLLRSQQVGTDVVLTIDLQLQRVADRVLGDQRGAIVALDVATGEVLALASHPYYDPNSLDESWDRLLADPNRPLVDRALQGQYVPGSTFKVVTAGAALDLGIVEPAQRHHHEADLIVEGFRIRNSNHPQLTDLSFAEEFAWSCNPVFALLGLSMGSPSRVDLNVLAPREPYVWPRADVTTSVDRFVEYTDRFYVGRSIPFQLPTAPGRLAASPSLTPVELANTAFGQGDLQVTPLHMALAAATIANGGRMPAPYIAATAQIADRHVPLFQPAILRQVIGQPAAAALNGMMVLSVDAAYAQPARIPGVHVGGKTGTAEVGGGAAPHSWFIGYAPADRSGVAVAVILENRGSGTQFATPAGQQVLEAALRLGY
jgi:peptidoglycan glycosyltransferase